MVSVRRALEQRLVVGAILASAAIACGFAVVWIVVHKMLEVREIRELSRVSSIGAVQIGSEFDGLANVVRELAEDRLATVVDSLDERQALLDSARSRSGGLISALVVSGPKGEVTVSSPAAWAGASAVAGLPTTTAALNSHTVALAAATVVIGDRRFAQLLAPESRLRKSEATAPGVLSVLINLELVRQRFVDALRGHGSDVAVLATATGEPLAVAFDAARTATPDQWSHLDLPGDVAAILGDPLLSLGGLVRVGDTSYLMGDVAPVRVLGRTWRLVTFRPRGSVVRDAKVLLFVCSAFGLFTLAAGGALFVGLRLAAEANQAAVRDASHWRSVAAEARRADRWQIIAEEAHEPIVFLDGTRVVGGNRGAVEALDLGDHRDLLGRDFLEFAAAEEAEPLARRLERFGPTGLDPDSFRMRLLTARRRNRVVDMVMSVVDTAEGPLVRLSWQDLTSRERAEALLRVVVRTVPLSVLLTDRDGRLVWANQMFVDTCRYPAERFVGHRLLPIVDPRDQRRARVMMARAARGGQSESILHVRRTDGEVLAMAVRAAAVHVGSELYGIVVIGFDAAAASAFAGWESAPDGVLLAQLGTLLAHRLNNDLQGLVGVVEQAVAATEKADVADEARRLVANAARQLQQFSILSRSGRATVLPVSLGALLESWRARVAATLPPGVRLVTRSTLMDDVIQADAGQIALLLDLALASALPELTGGGTFEAVAEASPRRGAVRLTLFDTGSVSAVSLGGGPESLLVRPARDMVRAVARLVARHHGGITGSKSSVAIGNRLWCDLQVSPEPVPRSFAVRQDPRTGAILVADDEELVRRTLADALREIGHEVVEVANGADAVHMVAAEPERFILVVLDLVMPVLDGREAFRRIREAVPSLPVLLCTGYDPAGDPVLSGADLMVKPFGIDEFIGRVSELVLRAGGQAADGDRMHP